MGSIFMKKRLPLIAGILSSVLFGFHYLATKTAMNLNGNDQLGFLAFRYAIAFPIMLLMLLTGYFKADYHGKDIRILLVCGLLNPIIGQYLEFTTIKYIPTSQLALIICLIPILVVLFSAKINQEAPSKTQLLLILVAVVGMIVIHSPKEISSGGIARGLVLALVTCVAVAIQRLLVRRASGSFSAFEIIFVSTGMGFVIFSAASILQRLSEGTITGYFGVLSKPSFVIALLYSGIVCCVAGFVLMTYAAANLPIAVSSATNTVATAVSVFAGVFLLKEVFVIQDMMGTLLVIGAVFSMSFCYNSSKSNKYEQIKVEKPVSSQKGQ